MSYTVCPKLWYVLVCNCIEVCYNMMFYLRISHHLFKNNIIDTSQYVNVL